MMSCLDSILILNKLRGTVRIEIFDIMLLGLLKITRCTRHRRFGRCWELVVLELPDWNTVAEHSLNLFEPTSSAFGYAEEDEKAAEYGHRPENIAYLCTDGSNSIAEGERNGEAVSKQSVLRRLQHYRVLVPLCQNLQDDAKTHGLVA